jgi:hypothetical protein
MPAAFYHAARFQLCNRIGVNMIFIFIWLAFGVVTALAANARGRSAAAWFVIGIIGGVFALVAVLVMEDLSKGGKS